MIVSFALCFSALPGLLTTAGIPFPPFAPFTCVALFAPAASAQDPPRPRPPWPRPGAGPQGAPPSSTDAPAKPAEDKKDEEKKEPKEEDRYFAVVGGRVHTVSGGVLPHATILCKNGAIQAVGPGLSLPEKTEVLDATGHEVYPGLVAVDSSGIFSGRRPDDATDPYSLTFNLALAVGITTARSGNSIAKLTFGEAGEMTLADGAFVDLSYTTRSPDARRKLRASLDKLRQHLRDVEAYERKKEDDPKAEKPDDKWIKGNDVNYLKLLKREAVARISADSAYDLLQAADLAQQYGLRIVVQGAMEGWTVAPALGRAGISAIITPRTRMEADESLVRPNGSSISNAAILTAAGVPVAIVTENNAISTWGVAGQDLFHLAMEAAFGVRGGLSNDQAVRAITLDAARILGVDHRVGSIEPGKDADFAIVDGDLLHYMTLVRWTVVNGKIVYDKEQSTLFNHIRPGGDRDAPPPNDYWPRPLGSGG